MTSATSSRSRLARQSARGAGATYRAAVWTSPGRSEVQQCSLPQPAPQQLVLRLEGCGVCSSNVPVWEGRPWFTYPLAPGAPGHEGWGIIAAVGKEVTDLEVGQRVAAMTYGAYAEYDVADRASVVPLPPALDEMPFPGEPLACAYNVFRRSAVCEGDTVAVIGVGFLGVLLARLCKQAGAQVIAVSRRAFARQLARQQGADEALPYESNEQVQKAVGGLTQGRGCEVVIEATGAQDPLTLAGELVATRGRLVIAGYHQDGTRQVKMQSWNWRGIDVINAHERDATVYVEGMQLALDAVAAGTLDPRPLLTHEYSLDELPQALEITRQRPDGFLKAYINLLG